MVLWSMKIYRKELNKGLINRLVKSISLSKRNSAMEKGSDSKEGKENLLPVKKRLVMVKKAK